MATQTTGAIDAEIQRYQGEELYYAIEFFGAELARGVLVVGDIEEIEQGTGLHIAGGAVTEGAAAMIYPMTDVANTWVDPESGLPFFTRKELNERGEYRQYDVTFLPEVFEGRVMRDRRDHVSHYTRALPSHTHDAMSWIYAVRHQNLTPGSTALYYIYDGWKLSRVTITVDDAVDTLQVDGEFVDCARLVLSREVMTSEDPMPMIHESANLPPSMWLREDRGGEQVGVLWISIDERRLPVQIEFQNALITAIARLDRLVPPTGGY